MDTESLSCVACLWRRRRKSRDPKIVRITRARPPITPPATAPLLPGVAVTVPVGVELMSGVAVKTNVATSPVDVELMPGVTVVDESVPFWTTRCCSVRGDVELFPS